MIDADRADVADRRDPADDEAGQLVGLAGGRAPDVGLAGDGGQAGEVDPVRAGHEATIGSRPVVAVGRRRPATSRSGRAPRRRPRRPRGRVGRLVEDRDLEGHALARGGVDDAPDGGMVERVGHGAESSIGPGSIRRRCRRSSWPMAMSPPRAALDAAWPGWADDDRARRRRRRRRAPRRARSACGIDLLGRRRRLDRPGRLAALEAAGVADRPRRRPDKDESDTELAVRAAVDAAPTAIVILGALGGPRLDHALANVGLLALPALGGPPRRPPRRDRRADRAGHARPTATGGRSRDPLAGSGRRLVVSLLPLGDGVDGVTTDGLGYPLARRAAARRAGARPVERPRRAGRRGRPLRRGVLLVVEIACYAPTDEHPAARRPRARVALPDETGTVHRLADQRGRWTILYFYPKDDTPGCTVEACEFRDANETIHERGADVWGISPQGAASKRAFREKFGLPFTLLADEDHAGRRGVRLVGREAELRQDLLGHGADDLPRRPGRADRPDLAEGQAGGPRRRGPRRARRRCRRRAPGDGRRRRTCERDFARGGRRAKPRPEG